MGNNCIILGGGPGGYSAALVAAQKGQKVTLIERKAVGGTCLNRGCIPTKALLSCSELYGKIKEAKKYGINVSQSSPDLAAMIARKDKVVNTLRTGLEGILKKRGVRIIAAEGTFTGPATIEAQGEKIEGDSVIIATGTEVMRLWEGEGLITSDEALELHEIPATLLVVGAGAVGVELACFFSELGTRVTLVEMMESILPGLDRELSDTLARELKKKGIAIRTSSRIDSIAGGVVTFSDGKTETYERILQAVGRRFNTSAIGLDKIGLTAERGRIRTSASMETALPGIYAIGDIVEGSPLLAHSAIEQGIVAALTIAGEHAEMDYSAIPSAVYSHPEVASVGLTEDRVEEPLISKIPYRTMGRAHASGEIAGLIKIIAEKKSRLLKGVHIVGDRATEIIHEGVLALRMGATIEHMAGVIRAHPTFAEVYSEAFHLLEGRAIHFMA